MQIGDTATTATHWRIAHPKCKPRGIGDVVNVNPYKFGVIVSVRWRTGKYDQLPASDLTVLNPEDRTPDATTSEPLRTD